MERKLISPVVLLAGAATFLVWSIVLLATPGGSRPVELVQMAASAVTSAYAVFALIKKDPVHNNRCRYLVLAFGVIGIVMVLGLAADQRSSRTWARLGWGAALFGYVGSLLLWATSVRRRAATIALGLAGALLIVAGAGLTFNCDKGVQRSWCDPVYEKEQILAETIAVDGELDRVGRAGGSVGAAFVIYFVAEDADIEDVTHPPGEWSYQPMGAEGVARQRGLFTSSDPDYRDCRLNAKVEDVPAGTRQTIFVSCGVGT